LQQATREDRIIGLYYGPVLVYRANLLLVACCSQQGTRPSRIKTFGAGKSVAEQDDGEVEVLVYPPGKAEAEAHAAPVARERQSEVARPLNVGHESH
jgi:hypothetical protein